MPSQPAWERANVHAARADSFMTSPDSLALDLAGGDAPRDLARELPELALELPYSRLARVARDHLQDSAVLDRELSNRKTVFFELARDQVALRDLQLLLFRVAGERDRLHPVEERCRDVLDEVGCRDEEDFGQ